MPSIESDSPSPEHENVDHSSQPAHVPTPYKPSAADFANYYENFMPYHSIFRWLNHSEKPQKDFLNREFAFEYRSGAYQRYISFDDDKDFKKTVVKGGPVRFEVGAVYETIPKNRKRNDKSKMRPVRKEFVLDIDLTDYDDVRTCCSGTKICPKCWKFITLAIEIVDKALREDFGFKQMIWVFSGRRGVHCWISDYRVRVLDETRRRAIVEYLDILNVKSKNKNGISLRKPFHPHIERSLKVLQDQFVDVIIREQDPWRLEDRYPDLARAVPDFRLSSALLKHWKAAPGTSSAKKWHDVDEFYAKMKVKSFDIQDWKREMILKTMYPRLDVEVSRQMIHLLKSPFCIHPGTGNVCVPFNPKEKVFNPFTDAPNLSQLFNEDEKDWKKTSLKKSVELFDRYVKTLTEEDVREKRKRDEGLDF